jgi:hypothetical protein
MNCIVSFHMVCRLRYTAYGVHPDIHPAFILSASRRISCVCPVYVLSMSCVCPVYIRHSSGVHSTCSPFYHLRSILTFGLILPRILEQVLCPRYSTFYPFLLLSFTDVREIYKLHCIVLTVCRIRYNTYARPSRPSIPVCIPPYIPSISGVHPAPIPFYIFGQFLPSVESYRGFLNKSRARDTPFLDLRDITLLAFYFFLS